MSGQRRLQAAGQCNQGHALTLENGQDSHKFVTFAAVGDGQHHVHGFDHAQVAVTGLARVDKHGGGACGGQCGGNFSANVPTFAHAGDDHTALHGQHHVHGLDKALIQPALHAVQGGGLDIEGFAGKLQGAVGMGMHGGHFIGQRVWHQHGCVQALAQARTHRW